MRLAEVIFLTVEDVEDAHAVGIARAGGDLGVRDRNLVESAAIAPQSGYYDSFAELAAVLAFGLAKNHGFIDGNKRAAFLSMDAFLRVNGFALDLKVDAWGGDLRRRGQQPPCLAASSLTQSPKRWAETCRSSDQQVA